MAPSESMIDGTSGDSKLCLALQFGASDKKDGLPATCPALT